MRPAMCVIVHNQFLELETKRPLQEGNELLPFSGPVCLAALGVAVQRFLKPRD